MDEDELRRLAREARAALGTILDGDDEAAARLAADIDAALALPVGGAKRTLRRVLMSDPRLHAWVQARIAVSVSSDRGVWARPWGPIEVRNAGEQGDGPGRGSVPEPTGGPPPAAPRPRHLHARMPDRVETGRPLSVVVAVTLAPRDGASGPLNDFVVPPEGVDLTVLVAAPGLVLRGEREATIHVPSAADSDPHRFAFAAGPVGVHTVTVEAFHGGTYLGAVSLQVSVDRSVGATEERVQVAELPTVATEPGEVTLQVRRDADGYRFQLVGDAWYDEITSPMGDVTVEVSQLAAELRAMAANKSPYRSGADVRDRVRQLGIGLWSAAVPEAVQRQFWRQAGRIGTFTVVADTDTIPWELLYPLDETHDNGFLAEQFPVVRRVYGAPRITTLPMGSAAYVVPPNSPENALEEVAGVRSRLGDKVDDRGVVSELAAAKRLVRDSPGLLHFACHNAFSDTEGASIKLDGGPWKPTDLAEATTRRTMAAASPLVFLNACRSAGEADWFSRMNGWARGFVGAGAGAFVGTLWAVRSSAARTFADAFYQQLVDEAQPLGTAALNARAAIADDDGDPTWLAYTVYGNPAARATTTVGKVIS